MTIRPSKSAVLLTVAALASGILWLTSAPADSDAPNGGRKKNPKKDPVAEILAADEAAAKISFSETAHSLDAKRHRDFPNLCLDASGQPWVLYIENDGQTDTLQLARMSGGALEPAVAVSQPGVLHQPALARDGTGGLWCVWGQVDTRNIVTLRARHFVKGQLEPEMTLASSEASDSFADAGTDAAGRTWVAWQSLRRGQADVFVRWFDSEKNTWSKEIAVSPHEGGNWEPRLAFSDTKGAWIVYDSSRGGDFNLWLARVALDGSTQERQLTNSPEYEARASIAWDQKNGLWIAGERGRRQWGMKQRGHDIDTGFNGHKRLLVGHYDIAKETFTEVPVFDNGRPAPMPMVSPGFNVDLPSVAVDSTGNPWIAYRVCNSLNWRVALLKYDVALAQWSLPVAVPDSTMGQDRHNELTRAADGALWLCWPSDRRVKKDCGIAGVYVGKVDTQAPLAPGPASAGLAVHHLPEPAPYRDAPTPDRPRDQHHTWTIGGKTYHLVYGDLHRHTDISNCRTGGDGCIVEHFRYAYDCAALDFMGTSDHTDVGKKMDPYEWWQTQRLVDVFYAPGKFTSLYAYEREQPYPWGHRNVIFAQRGGPVVYIKRPLYRQSPWQEALPLKAGFGEITPMELWDVLSRYGKPVALISHTGATGMGTDWDKYDAIDGRFENTVEIYQGARVSYEGLGAPQPTVGLRKNQAYTADTASKAVIPAPPAAIEDFGEERNPGVYQHALAKGHKLGVFASSDHISQHCAFGGVYVEEFTREGLINGFKARHTIAATDKIFVQFSANGHMMGEAFSTTEKPSLEFGVGATAPLKRITIVRNEQNWKVIEPPAGAAAGKISSDGPDSLVTGSMIDDTPLPGENRYYLRVEQADGSMAWSSPVWVKTQP